MSIAISVENLWKEYRLGTIGHGVLFRDLQSWFARVLDRDDPNAPIGEQASRRSNVGDRVWALREVSFEVNEGEVLGIIGGNGAGKSTLLKIISRVTGPTRGQIKIRGRVASLLEVGTGFHPELTGRENVFLNGAILGMVKAEIKKKFDEIVDFSGVEQYIDTPVKRYSSGMRVRLAFAVAAHLEPEILVVDEVLAVGDASFQRKCLGKIGEVVKGGRTVLFVTHNMAAVQQLCDEGICFGGGKIRVAGRIANVVKAYYSNAVLSLEAPREEAEHKGATFVRHSNLMDQTGKEVAEIDMGSPFGIKLCIEGKVRRGLISIKINNEIAENIMVATTRRSFKGQLNLDSNTVICWFRENRLMHGPHTISIWFGTTNQCLEWLPHCIHFLITPRDLFGTGELLSLKDHGSFYLDHRWQII